MTQQKLLDFKKFCNKNSQISLLSYSIDGNQSLEEIGSFSFYDFNWDIIFKAIRSIYSYRKAYGPNPLSGHKGSIHGAPKKSGSARVGRSQSGKPKAAPQVRGGRKAHPPKLNKNYFVNINLLEEQKAFLDLLLLSLIPNNPFCLKTNYPFIVDGIEKFSSIAELKNFFGLINSEWVFDKKSHPIVFVVVPDNSPLLQIKSIPFLKIIEFSNFYIDSMFTQSGFIRPIIYSKQILTKLQNEFL